MHLPIFNIQYIDVDIDFKKYDALIFTSKNAVQSLQYFKKNYINTPAYSIAPKTTEVLKKFNSNVVYTGISKNADDFAHEIKEQLINKKVLYIRAKSVVSKLNKILNNNNVICDEIITYNTTCNSYSIDKKPKKNSILIFTSPSSIKCFLKNFTWDISYQVICIGKTTASYLPVNITYNTPDSLNIQSCIQLAYKLQKDNNEI
jgi:uroporphyrinogen-III synthase